MEYSRFNTNINKEWVHYSTLSGSLFSYTNGAHEIFCLSFVLWSFQVLGKDSIDYGIRSGKSLSFGIPKAPQGNIQGQPKPNLVDSPEGIPSFVFFYR